MSKFAKLDRQDIVVESVLASVIESFDPDKVFGKLTLDKYKCYHGSYKLKLFGNTYDVKLSIDCVDDSCQLTEKQAKMFMNFEKKIERSSSQIAKELVSDVKKWKKIFHDKTDTLTTEEEVIKNAKPKTILINEEKCISIFFDVVWDPEHGLTVQVIPNIKSGDLGEFW